MNSDQAHQMIVVLYDIQGKIRDIKEKYGGFGEFSKHMRDAEYSLLHAIREVKIEEEKQKEADTIAIVKRRGM